MISGSADVDRASPTANPVGRTQGGLIELKRTVVVLACGLGLSAACAAPAAADAGGAYSSVAATVSSVRCVAGCPGSGSAQTGSLLRLRGRSLNRVRKIVFLGGRGAADDVRASTSKRTATTVVVAVPARASSGRLRAVNDDGLRATASRATVTIKVGGSGPLDARVVGSKVFQGAARPARLDLLARKPLDVVVVLARVMDGAIVQSWPVGQLAPGVVRSVTWDGKLAGAAQPNGRYEFRVLPGAGARIQAAANPGPLATGFFDLVDHMFPIRGRHDFGGRAAGFGTGRSGHTHQGHDVFAKCGTRLVAARGGVVKLNKYQGNAGNYIVIDGDGTDIDYAYMHMQSRSVLKKGARVLTGQEIGRVGDTGRAHGCHLHFEMWAAPGWYTGGKPVDPLAYLKAWDELS